MPLIPYEDIARLDRGDAAFLADEVLARGWVLGTYAPVALDAPLPRMLASQAERSLNFHLHSWDPVEPLLQAHSRTGEAKYLEAAVAVARDWVDRHAAASQEPASPFAWYDMAVGLRSYRLAYIPDAGTRSGLLVGPPLAALSDALERHARYPAADENIAFHNNHGYYRVAGQLAMGRRFASSWPVMAEAAVQARERLHGMLAQQFGADGVHREHSPDYHRMVYETLRAMMASGLVDDEAPAGKALAIERALSWFVLPSGHIANFGDSDYRQLRRRPEEAVRKWATPQMQHAVTQGLAGEAPDADHAAFPDGGYFVVRRPAGPGRAGHAQAGYLAQTAAFHSRTHKHADDLSFIWSDRGSDLLVDAGRYGYGQGGTGNAALARRPLVLGPAPGVLRVDPRAQHAGVRRPQPAAQGREALWLGTAALAQRRSQRRGGGGNRMPAFPHHPPCPRARLPARPLAGRVRLVRGQRPGAAHGAAVVPRRRISNCGRTAAGGRPRSRAAPSRCAPCRCCRARRARSPSWRRPNRTCRAGGPARSATSCRRTRSATHWKTSRQARSRPCSVSRMHCMRTRPPRR
ncbi:hypothetical protein HK414_16235 [Ramlibacter terrae]|uniref:Heparin-sulfate lyase N-terminal domain-containing protein n=1 Tax=Ramlibacter terrae TaxID=2732511 RepID=A0ABX6P3N8_9BURK|nr:hypothetical protein HK414_16235 [Ramlibacter terrae]